MVFVRLIAHYVQAQARSVSSHESMLGAIVFTIGAVYVICGVGGAGWFVGAHVDHASLEGLHTWMLPLAGAYFGIRLLFEKVVSVPVRPYLVLPISRSTLAWLTIARGLLNGWTLGPLVFWVPFSFAALAPLHSATGIAMYVVGIAWGLILTAHLTACARYLTHMRLFPSLSTAGATFVLIGVGMWTDTLRPLSGHLMDGLLQGNVLEAVSIVSLVVTGGALHYAASLRSLNVDRDRQRGDDQHRLGHSLVGLLKNVAPRRHRYLAAMLLLEARLITRNRRTRQLAYAVALPLLSAAAGLYFHLTGSALEYSFAVVQIGFFSACLPPLVYGAGMFAREGTYFDALMTKPLSDGRLLRTKLSALTGFIGLLWLIPLPVLLFTSGSILGLLSAFSMYAIGIVSPITLLGAQSHRRPVPLDARGFVNPGRLGATIHLAPLLGLPVIVGIPVGWFFIADTLSTYLWGLVGIACASLLAYPLWIRMLSHNWARKRYGMLEGFHSPQ